MSDSLNPLVDKIRTAYPGAYDDMDDATLTKQVLAKFPQYSDLAAPAMPQPQVQMHENVLGKATQIAAGAAKEVPRLFQGALPQASPSTQLPPQLQAGLSDAGKMQPNALTRGYNSASDFISHLTTPEGQDQRTGAIGADVGAAVATLPGFIKSFIGMIPSTTRASAAFQDVMGAAKGNAVPVTDELKGALSRYQELVDAGGRRSVAVQKLMKRVADPNQAPLTYKEGRDFYSNISRLSANEYSNLNPTMQRQVGAIRAAFNDAVEQAAEQSGKGQQYAGAMKEFAQGSRLQDELEFLKGLGKKQVIRALEYGPGGAVAGYAAKKAMDYGKK